MRSLRALVGVFVAAVLASSPLRARAQSPGAGAPADLPPSPYPTTEPQAAPSAAAPPPAAPAPPPPPAPVWSPPPQPQYPPSQLPPAVFVEIRTSSTAVRIDQVVGQARVPVCFAPCRRWLPRNNIYIIDGEGIRPTSQFTLPDDRAQVTLDVQPGSSARHAAGVVLAGGGAAVAYFGLVALSVNDSNASFESQDSANRRGVGGVALLVGLAAAVVGLVLMGGTDTRVVSSTGSTFTEAPARPRARHPAVALTARGLEF